MENKEKKASRKRLVNKKKLTTLETIQLIIDEHKSYSSQIFMLAKSDLVKTYKGSALGWSWAVIKPMTTIFVFWFCFTIGLRSGKPVDGYPYFLWLIAGFLPWFYMSDILTGGAGCIRKYKHLVTKMRFPVSIIPTFFNISNLYIHFVLFGIAFVIFVIFGFYPDKYLLQIPIYMIMMFAFFVVWGLFSGLLSCVSKDFQNLIGSISKAIFWMSGIIFDINKINHEWVRTLLKFNPVTVIATGYRNCFIYKKWFFEDSMLLIGYFTTLIVFTALAIWAFKRLRREIPDVL